MQRLSVVLLAVVLGLTGCKKEEAPAQQRSAESKPAQPASDIKADKGVDLEKKIIYIGALNDESGPAAAIGKPYAAGKRLLVRQVNAPNSGLLPDGWKLELIEKDHAYNPQSAVQAYSDIQDRILFLATTFGTPNTLPLREKLAADEIVAFPASLSSEMAQHEYTPPIGASYKVEAMRAMDWVVEKAGGADKVKAAIVSQGDDYGKDGLEGWTAAAQHHGVKIVSQQTIAPGQKDFAAVVSALKQSGANYVLLTVLPSASGPILGTAAQLKYMPTWIGQTPAWVDRFFDPKVIPPPVFTHYYWVTGLAFWGDSEIPAMKDFLALHAQHPDVPKDFYVLNSYAQGRLQVEALRNAIAARDVTRAGFLKALRELKDTTAGGMMPPVTLSKFPYSTAVQARVLKPVMDQGTWTVVGQMAEPKALKASGNTASDASK